MQRNLTYKTGIFAAELLGLPLIPPYTEATDGDRWRYGVNYASAAAGILDITGRNFVSPWFFFIYIYIYYGS